MVQFDPESGLIESSAESELPVEFGSVWKQSGRWFVLWHDGNALVFQAGSRRWKLDSGIELAVSGRFRRNFRICRNAKTLFSFSYWFRGSIWGFVDPTYDSLDEEADDFFVYVTGMWKHWMNRSPVEFLKNWRGAG